MSVTPTTTKTELREISSTQKDGSGNHASNNQPINDKRSEQVFGIIREMKLKLKTNKSNCVCPPMELRLSNWIIAKREASIAGF
ncbi:hypothetical protein BpHYR1_026681 [Brachionus plicatilis]|uniref:Uncharacterized protein n=1 Tax=Brachionus plicatilis TaxID=10195 RepID=A0A3M7PHD1_BRAPC|nr:hypothetical protein BpHYR1_026681 [Brachionus plicatilis]